MSESKHQIFTLNPDIWGGVENPIDFCSVNKPIETLTRKGWQQKPFNLDNIKSVTPGTGIIPDGSFRVGVDQIWGPQLLNRDMFLDVGCGPRGMTTAQGRFVYGIDPVLNNPILPSRVMEAVAEDIPFTDSTFDGVYSDKSVGFYPDLMDYWQAIREMIRVMKEERVMIIRTGQRMTKAIYQETKRRVEKAGHNGDFSSVSSHFTIFKTSSNWEI